MVLVEKVKQSIYNCVESFLSPLDAPKDGRLRPKLVQHHSYVLIKIVTLLKQY
jgi:hypothetical protein